MLLESLLGFVLISMIIVHLMIFLATLRYRRSEALLDYQMHQVLVLNLLQYEAGEPVTEDEDYVIYIESTQICIEYQKMNNQLKKECLIYEP